MMIHSFDSDSCLFFTGGDASDNVIRIFDGIERDKSVALSEVVQIPEKSTSFLLIDRF